MSSPGNTPNFLDKNTLIAVAVVAGFFLLWTRYVDTKYPKKPAAQVSTPAAMENKGAAANPTAPAAQPAAPVSASAPSAIVKSEEKILKFETPLISAQISSKGMGLKNVRLLKYQTRDEKPVVLSAVEGPGSFSIVSPDTGLPIDFEISQKSDLEFVGRGQVNGSAIERTIRFSAEKYDFTSEIKILSPQPSTQALALLLTDHQQDPVSSSFLVPTYDFQDWYIAHEGTSTRTILQKKNEFKSEHRNVTVAALSFHYFTSALLDKSAVAPVFRAENVANAPNTSARLIYQPVVPAQEFLIQFTGFLGPKLHSALTNTDERLGHIVDFGMFRVLAQPMLQLLKFFFSFTSNWGIAIILLTLVIRVVVLPFNVYSFKSMKALQKIQPQMNALKEKYKNDPQRMNQEVMALMKESKANPLGGCLPILLQMPVFFALNAVLGQSIELYRVPFFGWVKDLSAHDPYFVLPALMCIAMFVQTKISPAPGGDPQQQKIMQFVPIIFSLLMIFIPSGLSLYILVNTGFGIIQQYYLMRDRNASPSTIKTAKA